MGKFCRNPYNSLHSPRSKNTQQSSQYTPAPLQLHSLQIHNDEIRSPNGVCRCESFDVTIESWGTESKVDEEQQTRKKNADIINYKWMKLLNVFVGHKSFSACHYVFLLALLMVNTWW
ncbi:hypothetical protein DINM_000361 [Dirofilaria immitis]|nr:hypothetical protein [Dirofilaria immitis]